jgi:SAM-dependent methyltransferase
MMNESMEKDYLHLNIKSLPYFRGLLRAVEARQYPKFNLTSPTLDLGCGDGHFAGIAFDRKVEVGIDPWKAPVIEAGKTGAYHLVIEGAGDRIPFPDEYFNSAFSNSVLEHIPDLDPVLAELGRVLKKGSTFVFCVPNHHFLGNLSISNGFDRMGLRGLGNAYRGFFNRISRHHHCDSPETWELRLKKAGFEVTHWWHYFSPEALHILEWGHYLGLPSWICKQLFGKWILVDEKWNLSLTRKLIERFYQEDVEQVQGSYSFYIARKI